MRSQLFHLARRVGVTRYLRRTKREHLTVLSLHRISDEDDFFFQPIRPSVFETLLGYVTRHYTVTNFHMLRDGKQRAKPPLILSFDDGDYDFLQCALPLLNKFGLPSNHNLVNGCLNGEMTIWTQDLNDIFGVIRKNSICDDETINGAGKTLSDCGGNWHSYYLHFFRHLLRMKYEPRQSILDQLKGRYSVVARHKMMDWTDAARLVRNGVEIGSHSYRHDVLSTLTTEAQFGNEVGKSVQEIEEKLGVVVDIFAPPNGQYNLALVDYAKRIGIKSLLLVDDAITPLSNLSPDFSVISRIGLANESEAEMQLRTELFHSRVRSFR